MSICILIWHFCLSPTHSYLGNYQRIPETQISRLMENFGPYHPLLKFACFRRLVILEGICRHPYSTATEAKAGCWCRSGVRWGRYWKILGGVSIVMGKGSGKGLRQLASMNSKNCELWTGEICQRCLVAVGFFSGKSCWGHPQSRSLGTVVTPPAWQVLVAPSFLPYS